MLEQREFGHVVTCKPVRRADDLAHYIPEIEPNNKMFTFGIMTGYKRSSLARALKGGFETVGYNITPVNSTDFYATVKETQTPLPDAGAFKFLTIPGFEVSYSLGVLDRSTGFVDIACNLKAPSLLFTSQNPIASAWTMEIRSSSGIRVLGKAIARILVRDDADHSFAQFIAKQAVEVISNNAESKLQVSFRLQIDPAAVDWTSDWAPYKFTAEVVTSFVLHKYTRLAIFS